LGQEFWQAFHSFVRFRKTVIFMRILYHHRTLSKDGQAVHIEEMIAALRRAGHEVCVVGPPAHQKATFGSDGGFVTRLRAALPRAIAEMIELSYSVVAFLRLWRACRRFRPDALYERYNLFMLAGAWLCALSGIPYGLEVNAPLVLERSRTPGLALKAIARACERYVWRRADVVFPVTGALAKHVAEVGVPAARMKVIANGIDLAHFPPTLSGAAVRARYGLGERIVIGFTGFMRAWHGVPAVVEVMREFEGVHDVHFLLVGDGDGRAELEREAQANGIGHRITVTGIVQRDQIPAHTAAFDIAMQPKATAYASPLKLFEYMGLARAIIAPDQPNLREVLEDGVNALLFTPDDVAGLRAALRRLIADAGLRKRLGEGAYRTLIEGEYTWDANARRVVAALTAVLEARARPAPAPTVSSAETA
jgi:glycosyltransferase involved in cell wall biosynthesis